MNTYDPSDHILYVHLSGPAGARSAHTESTTATCTALPSGYANQSPHTRLQRRAVQVREDLAGVSFLTA
ncbi:hypothetical protein ACI782_05175 [Geodermatophilus sp. SYSU D00703]